MALNVPGFAVIDLYVFDNYIYTPMKHFKLFAAVLIATVGFQSAAKAQLLELPDSVLRERHHALMSEMPDGGLVAVRAGSEQEYSSVKYRPEANWFWLTGRSKPGESFLMFQPGFWSRQPQVSSVLFSDAVVRSEVFDTVMPVSKFQALFNELNRDATVVYAEFPQPAFVSDWLSNKGVFVHSIVEKNWDKGHPSVSLQPVINLTSRHRAIKTTLEIERVQQAIRLTANGLADAIKVCTPGIFEWNLQATVECAVLAGGASGTAFPSIIGSGKNALELHYSANSDTLKPGDLVVMDVGAWYRGYSADVTRTIPVSGRFTLLQSELYHVVLEAREAALNKAVAGNTLAHLQRAVLEVYGRNGYSPEYMPHGVSHSLGIDVHDALPDDTLRCGMIITIEPGLYIPAGDTSKPSGLWNTGIRLEDDVLITINGPVVLSGDIPLKPSEIEKLMEVER